MDNDGREMYFEAVKLAEAGSHEAALSQLEAYLRDHPTDGEALNDAGTILFCLHRGPEAIDYFQRARGCCEGEKLTQVYWNLCEAAVAENRPEIAIELLDDMEAAEVLNIDMLNRLARLYVDREDCGTAIDLLQRSLNLSPEQEVLSPMLEVIRSRRASLTVAGRTERLPSDLVEFFRVRYPGAICRTTALHEIRSATEPEGILLFVGADAVLSDLTRGPKPGRLIVRLGWEDLYQPALADVQWGNVDVLIVPDESAREQFLEGLDIIPSGLQVAVVRPGLDLEGVPFQSRTRGRKVAAIGPWDGAGNPMLLLQCIQRLHAQDEDMRFYLAGEFPDPAIENYVLHLIEKLELDNCVFLDGTPRNWGRWLKDKHYIVSTAVDARCLPGVWRAMAAGLKPVVHAFAGAEAYLEAGSLFLTVEDFCEAIAGGEYTPEAYRQAVLGHCSRRGELQGLDQVVRAAEKGLPRKPGLAVSPSYSPAPATQNMARPVTATPPAIPVEEPVRPSTDFAPTEQWTAAPTEPATPAARSIEAIAMEALEAARRQSNGESLFPGGNGNGDGGMSGPF